MELWKVGVQGNNALLPEAVLCPACEGQVLLASPQQVYLHLHSREHREVEGRLVASAQSDQGSVGGQEAYC